MKPQTRCREYREGNVGRWRTYRCRVCGEKFQQFRLGALPVKDRVCPECKRGEM